MLKSFIVKILARLFLTVGFIVRRRKALDVPAIRTVLINRADRLGDAVLSLPFLLELQKYFDVTVLTSEYNDYFLSKFLKTRLYIDKPLSFLMAVKMIAAHMITLRRPQNKLSVPQYDAYVDLMGIRGMDVLLRVKEQNLCRYYIDFNLGPWNTFLDYADKEFPALFSKAHIVDSYKGFIKRSLRVNLDVSDYVDFTPHMVKPDNFNRESPFILVNIAGFDKFRGPSPEAYATLLNKIQFKGRIFVMDELGSPNLAAFKSRIDTDTIRYLEKDYSIEELLYISSNSLLYIGSDSGISHLLQTPTHAVLFFGNPFSEVWRPYSKNPYATKKITGIVVEDTVTSRDLRKKIIHARQWCRPCFDIGCKGKRCVTDLEKRLDVIIEEIHKMLEANPLSS